MRYFILICAFFSSFSFAVESLQISSLHDSLVLLEHVKVLKDTSHLNENQAYALFNENKFDRLPLHVKSFGVSNATYWVALKLKNSEKIEHFLEFKYDQLTHIDSFIFRKDQHIHSSSNGNAIRMEDREIEHFFVRFPLLRSDEPLTYLFKITSKRPMLIAMQIGTKSELDYEKLMSIISVALFSGCLFLLFITNVMLYLVFKIKEYLFYGIYLACFWIFIIYIHHYTFFVIQEFLWVNDVIKVASTQGFHSAFLLFTIYFLNIKGLSPVLIKLTYVIYALSFIAFLFLGMRDSLQNIAFIAGILTPLYWMFLGLIALHQKIIFAKLYLLGLLGFYIGALFFWLMQLGVIDVPRLEKNVFLLGSTWEMIIFTWMLIFKTKLMKADYSLMKSHIAEVEKERLYQSRYISIGRTIGNIAHQWKQPLNALGAILTHMKSSFMLEQKIRKKELINEVDMSFEIVQHLSETINTFYSFLLKPYTQKSQFSITEELKSIQKMLDYSFKNDGIQMHFHSCTNAYIDGNSNEFIQCILNILLNAKDQFYNVACAEASIDIYVSSTPKICHISIQDNAGGVTIQPIESIFELNISSKQESAGVGLFICKDIIESRFNGTIHVENKDDGACFIITIPISS